ncbi:NAD(P)-binding protein [Ascoidea rubescens DSM 1968]|uniref:NAD(P)-binding protein n=1 Tax=Ascoidea rubescens DSM 1968 TaxID=1344418 RepID=A0A1D2VJG1_9ASCO|nr:NAD(P)-binding protein [Ascoidea rubescens DSM 1968]ODV61744.1 NAD(P)-binding protein [Ascoidea rubescens DSM 1968]
MSVLTGNAADLFSLDGKVALITGATNGIGQIMAVALSEANIYQIIFVHRPATDPTKTIDLLVNASKNKIIVSSIDCDLSSENLKIEQIDEKIVQKAINLSYKKKIDILINNAGITVLHPFIQFPDDEIDEIFYINWRVPAKLAQLVGQHMIENKVRGKIIFTSSVLSVSGALNLLPYVSTKGAITQTVKALSNEWSKYGINVNALGPGIVETKMSDYVQKDERIKGILIAKTPYGRLGLCDDLKGPTIFLSSKASDFMCGSTLFIDGGYLGV